MVSFRTSRKAVVYLAQEAGLIVLFVYFLLFANTWRAYADYTLIRNGVVMLLLASAVWLFLRLRRQWVTAAPLTVALPLFIAVYFFTALVSIQPSRSMDEVWVFGLYAFGLALVAQLAANGWPRELFIKTLLLAGSLLMGISLVLVWRWYASWLAAAPGQWIPDIAYRLPLANGQATYLYLMTFAVLTRLRVTRARLPRMLLAGWLAPAAVLLFLTASRGGWLATAAGLIVLALVAIRDAGGFDYVRRLWDRARTHKTFTLLLVLIAVLALAGLARLAAFQIQNPQKGPALLARVEFWVPAWQAFLARPIFGQGPLTFGSAYLRINSVPPYGFFAHAHSIFFNLLAETGIVGTATFGFLALATFLALWRQVNHVTGEDRAVVVAALAGAVAWAVHSLVDTVQVEPMNSLVLAVLLGASLGRRPPDEPAARRPAPAWFRDWWPIGLGISLSLTGLFNLWRLAPYYAGVQAGAHNDWSDASQSFAQAASRDTGAVPAFQALGLADSILAAKGDASRLSSATRAFERAAQLDPDWWLNHSNLAALYLASGNQKGALDESRLAAKLGWGSPLTQLNYGVVAEAAGQPDEARKAYGAALALRPDWAEAYFWRATPLRVEVAQAWRAAQQPKPALSLADMQALAKGGDESKKYTPLAAEYLRQGRLAEADNLLQRADLAYTVAPEDQLEVLWLKAELAARRGNLTAAVALGQRAVSGYQAQSALGAGSFGQAAYGQVFFRRDALAADLVPQLTLAPFTDRWAARLLAVGDWQAKSGDGAGAAETFRQLLELVPDDADASDRLK
jgi:O-antigen ligase/Tfp pilus assembly protein PilF